MDASVGADASARAGAGLDASAGTSADSGAYGDAGADVDSGTSADADAAAATDAGPDASPPGQTLCTTLPPLDAGTCVATKGSAALLIEGNVLAPDTIYVGGQVAIAATGDIACVGCDCADGGETIVACPGATISPGLIDVHDHITYTQNAPAADTGERYDDRQQWREGLDGHTKLTIPGRRERRPGPAEESSGTSWPARRRSSARAASRSPRPQPRPVGQRGGLGLTSGLRRHVPAFGDTDGTRRTGDQDL